MAKLTLDDISNIFLAVDTINANNAKIEAAVENTLSRDGTLPNQMDDDLDMNNRRIYNLPDPVDDHEPALWGVVKSLSVGFDDALQYITDLYEEILGMFPDGLDVIDGGYFSGPPWVPSNTADGGTY